MRVLKGTYRVSLWEFVTAYAKNIKDLTYTREEAHDCVEMINNGILQFLKIYVINGDLKSCCKLITIARDFLNNKFADKTGRYFNDYSDEERFYMAHITKFDYMEVVSEDQAKVQRLVDLIGVTE
jgi:hypothetical protein